MTVSGRMIGWFHAHSGPLAPAPGQPDHNLSHLGDEAKNFRTRVVNPLNSSFSMSAGTALGLSWQTGPITSSGTGRKMANAMLPPWLAELASGISVAAYGVNGAYGAREIAVGLQNGDKKKTYSGMCDITQGVAATMYFIMKNPILCPLAGVMLSLRCLNRLSNPDKKDDRKDRLNGIADLGAGLTFISKVYKYPHPEMMALGYGICGIALLRGLHLIKMGHDKKTPEVEATGIGKLMLGTGLLLLLSGITTAMPAVCVLVAGTIFSMASEMYSMRKPMHAMVKATDWLLYPIANVTESAVGLVGKAAQPVLHAAHELLEPLSPVTKPIGDGLTRLADAAMRIALRVGNSINQTPFMRVVDAATGFMDYHIKKHLPSFGKEPAIAAS